MSTRRRRPRDEEEYEDEGPGCLIPALGLLAVVLFLAIIGGLAWWFFFAPVEGGTGTGPGTTPRPATPVATTQIVVPPSNATPSAGGSSEIVLATATPEPPTPTPRPVPNVAEVEMRAAQVNAATHIETDVVMQKEEVRVLFNINSQQITYHAKGDVLFGYTNNQIAVRKENQGGTEKVVITIYGGPSIIAVDMVPPNYETDFTVDQGGLLSRLAPGLGVSDREQLYTQAIAKARGDMIFIACDQNQRYRGDVLESAQESFRLTMEQYITPLGWSPDDIVFEFRNPDDFNCTDPQLNR